MGRLLASLAAGLLPATLHAAPAAAQDPVTASAPPSAPVPICTDRPTKANATCTVPAGAVQLETTAVGLARTDAGGVRTYAWTIGATVAKFGLDDRSDLQIGLVPYLEVIGKHAGPDTRISGIGDVTVRYKRRLTGSGAPVQVALIPFVKLPTARRGLGNNKIEGGMAGAISTALGAATLTFGPEVDLLADADGKGRHLAVVNLVNVAIPAASRLTVVGELWTATNFDPADTVTLSSADTALAYAVSNDAQFDFGVNLGLNRHTSNMEIYAGFSLRF